MKRFFTWSAVRAVMLGIGTTAAIAACAFPEPWVKPYERERLADPLMKVQRDALSSKHFEHIHEVREGSRGATGVQGGGCGCN